MIKLEKRFSPLCLNPTEVARLTTLFKITKKPVWNIDALKTALLETSHNKCAYCECTLDTECKYMEVEHFRNKDNYPDEVVDWANLLPSCKRCNGSKSSHDVNKSPIINPYIDDPKDNFTFHCYRLRSKTTLAQETIDVLSLNDTTRAVMPRFQVGEAIHKALENVDLALFNYSQYKTTKARNRACTVTRDLLLEAQPTAQFAATAATLIHCDDLYKDIIKKMKELALWTEELEELHTISENIALSIFQ